MQVLRGDPAGDRSIDVSHNGDWPHTSHLHVRSLAVVALRLFDVHAEADCGDRVV
jgi:hypothetical protein